MIGVFHQVGETHFLQSVLNRIVVPEQYSTCRMYGSYLKEAEEPHRMLEASVFDDTQLPALDVLDEQDATTRAVEVHPFLALSIQS